MPKSKLKDSRTNWMMHLVPKTWSYDWRIVTSCLARYIFFLLSISVSPSSFLRLENRRNANHHWRSWGSQRTLWWTRREPCRNRETTPGRTRFVTALSVSMLLPLSPEQMSRTPKFGIIFARLKLLKNHVKIWTTLSTNSENSLCSYKGTFSTSVILFVS